MDPFRSIPEAFYRFVAYVIPGSLVILTIANADSVWCLFDPSYWDCVEVPATLNTIGIITFIAIAYCVGFILHTFQLEVIRKWILEPLRPKFKNQEKKKIKDIVRLAAKIPQSKNEKMIALAWDEYERYVFASNLFVATFSMLLASSWTCFMQRTHFGISAIQTPATILCLFVILGWIALVRYRWLMTTVQETIGDDVFTAATDKAATDAKGHIRGGSAPSNKGLSPMVCITFIGIIAIVIVLLLFLGTGFAMAQSNFLSSLEWRGLFGDSFGAA